MRPAIRTAILGRSQDWSPRLLGTQLKAWWTADDLIDGAVSAWVDRVAALTLSQATSGNQPTKASTSWNGRAGVTFATDDYLEGATTGLPTGGNAGQNYIACSVGDLTTSANVPFTYGNNGNYISRRTTLNVNEAVTFTESGPSSGSVSSSSGGGSGNRILCGSWGATTLEGFVDGVSVGTSAYNGTLNTATTRARMGATEQNTLTGTYFNGVLRHVFVTSELSLADRQLLEGWIAWDCGIVSNLQSTHPYKNRKP